MKYGQVIVGPAGSGKTNYCKLMKEFFKLKKRNCYIINLDSASEEYYYERKKKNLNFTSNIEKELSECYDRIYDIDIRDYINVNELIEGEVIGPNCALLRSLEMFYENKNLLEDELSEFDNDENYFLIDTPGQIELYTHSDYFKKIINIFTEQNIKLVIVFLIDISFISSNTKLLSAYLTSLSTMINFELPHINILTKCDLVTSENYYENIRNFKKKNNLIFQKKLFKKLNKKIKENNDEYDNNAFIKELTYIDKSFKEEYIDLSDHMNTDSSCSSLSYLSDRTRKTNSEYSENENGSSSNEIYEKDEEKQYERNIEKLHELLSLDPHEILVTANKCMSKKYYKLNNAFASIIEEFNLISFIPLNIYDDDNVDLIIQSIDMIIQYGEEKDVNDNYDMNACS